METINSAQALGRAIRGVRIARGLSQQSLADDTGMSRKFISELEKGKESIELGSALRVAATMDIVWNAPDPTPQVVLDQAALDISREIANGDSQFALQLAMDTFKRLKAMNPSRLKKPQSTGSREFDALIAAGVRSALEGTNSTPPRWGTKLPEPWFPGDDSANMIDEFRELTIKRTPKSFAEFNIFLKDDSLEK